MKLTLILIVLVGAAAAQAQQKFDPIVLSERGVGPPTGFAEAFITEASCSGLTLKTRGWPAVDKWVVDVTRAHELYEDGRRNPDTGFPAQDPNGRTFLSWWFVHLPAGSDKQDKKFDVAGATVEKDDVADLANSCFLAECTLSDFKSVRAVVRFVCSTVKDQQKGQ